MSFITAAFLLAAVASVTCALPGIFVVLRRQSMIVDAISHAVLPGIVIGVALSGSLHSPIMVVAATLMGLIIVWASNWLRGSRLLAGDADQGVIFPALFSLGVLLLSTVFSNIHICTDTVLAGDLNLMALSTEHIIVGNYDIGPRTMWILLGVCAINALFIWRYFRVLETATFDRQFALTAGMPVRAVENMLMFLVALTIVAAFNVAGSILVIALMICPAATALLVSHNLRKVIPLTIAIAIASAIIGFFVAWRLDLPTSAMMAFVDGVLFGLTALVQAWKRRTKIHGTTQIVEVAPAAQPAC
ncbi:metal ABC transporter permease [Actinobaculum suis]|uniref:metal ABC transporter permease n=1 Tax=Actinobaculum suis TaxID=1657 RepID=UPI0008087D9B|nr:metal ABC transporter permease [Actinobaculum suis]OCA94709.1 zinc ABC transporter permease [Actinobaculum suis]OCA95402.1 zinc ABC transporter permease [Actinobaculum suis]